MKWVVLPLFIFTFLSGENHLQAVYHQSVIYSTNSIESTPKRIHNPNSSSFYKVFWDFEIEIEEEEEKDDNRHYSNSKSSQTLFLSLGLVLNQTSNVSLFSPRKLIKLFILFHSWKSFLSI